MNRPLVVSAFGGLVLVMWLAAWSVVGSAERSPENLVEFERSQTGAQQPAGSKSFIPFHAKKSLP